MDPVDEAQQLARIFGAAAILPEGTDVILPGTCYPSLLAYVRTLPAHSPEACPRIARVGGEVRTGRPGEGGVRGGLHWLEWVEYRTQQGVTLSAYEARPATEEEGRNAGILPPKACP